MAGCGGVVRAQGARQRRFDGGGVLYSTRGAGRAAGKWGKSAAMAERRQAAAPLFSVERGGRRNSKGGFAKRKKAKGFSINIKFSTVLGLK